MRRVRSGQGRQRSSGAETEEQRVDGHNKCVERALGGVW